MLTVRISFESGLLTTVLLTDRRSSILSDHHRPERVLEEGFELLPPIVGLFSRAQLSNDIPNKNNY